MHAVGLTLFGLTAASVAVACRLRARAHRLRAAAPARRTEARLSHQRHRGLLFAFNLAGKEFGRQSVNAPNLLTTTRPCVPLVGAKVRIQTMLIFGVGRRSCSCSSTAWLCDQARQGVRAVAQDADTASLMGVNVNRVIVLTFIVGGLLAGAGGFLYAQVGAAYEMGTVPASRHSRRPSSAASATSAARCSAACCSAWSRSYEVADRAALRGVDGFLILVLVLLFRPGAAR